MNKRASCTHCLRPQRACICRWVTPVAHTVEVLILQHPLEVDNAKGSARLLHLSLPNSRMLTGELFEAPAKDAQSPDASIHPRRDVLLYPDTARDTAPALATAPPLPPAWLECPAGVRLIVLDGTWRKSRKMLYLNAWLQQMPRLSLQDMPASRYLIRRAPQPGQLSTLEATCAALIQIEGGAHRFEPLLAAFDGFVAQCLAFSRKENRHSALARQGQFAIK